MHEGDTNSIQEFEYKAEMKQLLHLIIHSLYTNPEVFLRELVSNASDALNKLRFMQVTNTPVINPEAELRITIDLDSENRNFSIEDTGIGMTREDLIERIGTVAGSGTLDFLRKMKQNQESVDGSDLIGQFGVGFYSAFMVTDEITIETRHADPESKAYRWQSKGEGKFSIEEIDRKERGTRIYFKLKDEVKDFAEAARVRSVIKKYSNFVDFPIYIGNEKVNSVTAIWQRRKEEVKKEELEEFYKFIANDWREPFDHLHLNIEGRVNFKALVFVPTAPQFGYFDPREEKSLHLYIHRVFVQDNCKELVPEYLRFVKGVVDTDDLPLNISREMTQSSPVTAKIREVLSNRLLGMLEDWANSDAEKYSTFFRNFGNYLKLGINEDFTNKQRLVELLRFETSKTDPGKYTSLKEYTAAMPESQKEIYYLTGESRQILEKHPNLEYFRKHFLEVMFLTDPVDVFTIATLGEYDGKNIVSLEKADIHFADDETVPDTLSGRSAKDLLLRFKEILGNRVEDVIESRRLVDSVATLVVGRQGMDARMEHMMRMMDKNFAASKKMLEVNMAHPLVKNLSRLYAQQADHPLLTDAVEQIFEAALLVEHNLEDPMDFVRRMTRFMEQATRNTEEHS